VSLLSDALTAAAWETPTMLAYWDAGRRNVVANAAYARWAGITPVEMRGLHMREVLGDALYEEAVPYIDGALGGTPQAYERVCTDAYAAVRRAHVTFSPDVVAGRVVGLLGLGIELTGCDSPRGRTVDEADGALIECLTEREREVLSFLPTGLTTTEIAARLYVSVNTAKTHLKTLYRKLGVASRPEAISRGITAGLLGNPSRSWRTDVKDLGTTSHLDVDAVDEVIQRVFAAGLVLAGPAELVDGAVGEQIGLAIDLLDDLVRDLRLAVVCEHRARTERSVIDARNIVARLRDLTSELRQLAAQHAGSGAEPIQLGEAEHSVRRAVVVLTDDLLGPAAV